MADATSKQPARAARAAWWVVGVATVVIVFAAALFHDQWLPHVREGLGLAKPDTSHEHSDEHHDHDRDGGHDHSHPGHKESESIELSERARKNIGLQIAKVELKPFTRSILMPGIIVERPGRSQVQVTAPMTGIVTRIYPTEGEAIAPNQKLFEIRLTHEELVQSQADLLRTTEELDVIGREIERIEKLTTDGGLAGKTLLERKYEQQKQEAVLRSQRQALLLHGLSAEQIDNILQTRKLLQFLSVEAPGPTDAMATAGDQHFFPSATSGHCSRPACQRGRFPGRTR